MQILSNSMSDFRPEVKIWLFRAYVMHPAINIGTVRSLWTWLWGRPRSTERISIVRFQFRNSLYTKNVLYVVRCFRSFALTFYLTILRLLIDSWH